MPKKSAGVLVYRRKNDYLEVFLGHPGGPFYTRKDAGVWSIPKGEFDTEEPLVAAKREFAEETGHEIGGKFIELNPVRLRSGKTVFAWAVEGDLDAENIVSNNFTLEFPPRSGRMNEYPEIDRGGWFRMDTAREKILTYQLPLLSQLEDILSASLEQ